MEHNTYSIRLSAILLALAAPTTLVACSDRSGGSSTNVNGVASPLTAECLPDGTTPPADAWVCPSERTIECAAGSADVDTLYVEESDQLACASGAVSVSDAGPFGVGTHRITARNAEDVDVCSAQLTVVDTAAPTLTAHRTFLWPPNHKLHDIAVSDCVSAVDACDGDVQGEFIWASSDEPVDDIGDGHHAPDILFGDCQHVSLRAERQGPKDGRVYTLGVRFVDDAGNAVESQCQVIVDHDQRGVDGADSGEAYRIVLDGTGGTPVCDGDTGESDAGIPPGAEADGGGAAGTGATAGTGAVAGSGAEAGTTGAAGVGAAGVGAVVDAGPF